MEAPDQRPVLRAPDVPAAPDASTFGIATTEIAEVETAAVAEGALVSEESATEFLPTMGDLDRLAADLDRVDLTLAQLDDPLQSPNS